MITDSLDLRRHVAIQDIWKRTYGDPLVVWREERGHSGSRKDLLRIPHPLQHPIRPQSFVCKLEIRRKILRRFAGGYGVACRMTACTLQFHEEIGADTKPLCVGIDFGGYELVVEFILGRK